jgi:hypothetical protein
MNDPKNWKLIINVPYIPTILFGKQQTDEVGVTLYEIKSLKFFEADHEIFSIFF